MSNLLEKNCTACEIGAPLVPEEDEVLLLKDLQGWEIDSLDISKLVKVFKFSNYKQSLQFTNLIGDLAELEDHHPKITLEWGEVSLEWWSHKIKGLHMNDFICAAKSDEIYKSLN